MPKDPIQKKKILKHHQQQAYCTSRPAYRQGRKFTAIKAYTVNNESQHLYIYGVPQINLRKELKNLCARYGELDRTAVVQEVDTEVFTECFHVHFTNIQSARRAKRLLDQRSFYGGVLHICYAPECESMLETKSKLDQRKMDVIKRLKNG
ncbi:hypothetical protein HUJ04_002958 [Dendroctonus ponderosae]